MVITNYISKNIPILQVEDTIKKAKDFMLSFKLTHLPVVDKGNFLGNIRFENIQDMKDDEVLKNCLLELESFFLLDYAIIFDSLRVFSENSSNLVPVIDKKEKLLGIILEEDIIDEFANYPFITEYGVYMTVTTPIRKYSISEIANIVESNNGKILGLLITEADEETTKITIKLNAENISSIGDTFERFGYRISNKFFEDTKQELLKDRFDQLKKFMEL